MILKSLGLFCLFLPLFASPTCWANCDTELTTRLSVTTAPEEHFLTLIDLMQTRYDGLPGKGVTQGRYLGIPADKKRKLIKLAFQFLQDHATGTYEKDNLRHVMTHVQALEKYEQDFHQFLGTSYLDELVDMMVHDLGKSAPDPSALAFLETIFGSDPSSFVNLRVLPHELYSMYWIVELGKQSGLTDSQIHTVIDLIAYHNFGPDLQAPGSEELQKHWWPSNYSKWAEVINQHLADAKVVSTYGSTKVALSNGLAFFDRSMGGTADSIHKYLNQGRNSGQIFSGEGVSQKILSDIHNAEVQVRAMGLQLSQNFTHQGKTLGLENFRPYQDYLNEIAEAHTMAERMVQINRRESFEKYGLIQEQMKTVLYQSNSGEVVRVVDLGKSQASSSHWESDHWVQLRAGTNPVELLMDYIYADLGLGVVEIRLPRGIR